MPCTDIARKRLDRMFGLISGAAPYELAFAFAFFFCFLPSQIDRAPPLSEIELST